MKKQITFLLLTLLFAFSSNEMLAQVKNVLYLNQSGVEAPSGIGASTPGNDPITRMLNADANFAVSYAEIDQDFVVTNIGTTNNGNNSVGQPIDFTGFDLIIAQETMASSNSIFKTGNPLHPSQISIPVIYNKAYAFRGSSTALVTSDSNVIVSQNKSVTVTNTSNPMFSGIDFSSGNEVNLLRTTSDDKGNKTGWKALDIVNDLEISDPNTLLATVPEITDTAKGVVINYFTSGTQVGTDASGILGADAVAFSFSYGATVKKDGGNVTSEFLTIWRNAAYMLTGQTPPTTLFVNPDFDNYEMVETVVEYDFRDQTIFDAKTSPDGVINLTDGPTLLFKDGTYGLDMKATSQVKVRALEGSCTISFLGSEFSSLSMQAQDFQNKNNIVHPLVQSTTVESDLEDYYTFEFFGQANKNIDFTATDINGGSDIYLPLIRVTYNNLQKKPTKILYVNQTGVGQSEGASAPGADPVISMLNADENFEVTYVETPADGSAIPDLSGFDLVIAQESISSSAAMFQPGGVLGVKDVTIPIIYNKTWAFRNERAVTDADATVTATQNLSVTVDPTNQNNPMFSGINFSDSNDLRLFKAAIANDDGSVGGNKSIDVLNNLDISSPAGGSLATVPETTDAAKSFLINYLPAGTQLGEATTDVLTVDAVALAFSYGATILGDGANISPEALTIWRNAVYMLTDLEVPTTLVENIDYFIPMKVLYVNQAGVGTVEGASAPGSDPIIKMLIADKNFDVTYVEAEQDGTGLPDLSDFDLVIAQETISSNATMFQPGGILSVKDVTIPIIYNKTWAFRNGKAVTDADATVTATQNVSITSTFNTHPLFNGIDFSGGDDIRIFSVATANDDGSNGGNKAIDVLNNLDISSAAAASIATTPEVTDASKALVVNYMPAGTQLGEAATDVLSVNAVALSFSYGATIMGDGINISPEALTIWRNAAYMLTYGPANIPNTLVENPNFVLSIDKAGEVSKVSSNVRAMGNRVYVTDVKSSTEVKIYSITGALVKSFKTNTDTDFYLKTGLWIATVKTSEGAKAVKFLTK